MAIPYGVDVRLVTTMALLAPNNVIKWLPYHNPKYYAQQSHRDPIVQFESIDVTTTHVRWFHDATAASPCERRHQCHEGTARHHWTPRRPVVGSTTIASNTWECRPTPSRGAHSCGKRRTRTQSPICEFWDSRRFSVWSTTLRKVVERVGPSDRPESSPVASVAWDCQCDIPICTTIRHHSAVADFGSAPNTDPSIDVWW